MQNKRLFLLPSIAGVLLLIISGLWLGTAQPVAAQCGSQASSCKDCHETQAQDPVNTDGTNWHQAHAFGDFCYMCHAGNGQSTDKAASHTGMIAPMSDIKGSCSSCHVKDYTEKAQTYAATLGVSLAEVAPTVTATTMPTQSAPKTSADESNNQIGQTTNIDAPVSVEPKPVVDYIEQYNQSLAARQKTNWANILFVVFAGLLLLAGGAYGLSRLGWVKVSFVETKQMQAEFPTDVVEMLPDLAQLKPDARKSLQRVLKKSSAGEFLLSLDGLFGDEKRS